MNTKRSGMPPVFRWVIGALMVPVLYVLTFPPIVCIEGKYFSHSQQAMNFVVVYAVPYNRMLALKPLQRPLVAYHEFWRELFGYHLTAP